MRTKIGISLLILLCCLPMAAQTEESKEKEKLVIVWTSGDPEVANKVALPYTYNATTRGWFDHVVFIIWGPSAKLAATDDDIQAQLKKLQQAGVVVEACLACSDSYGVTEQIKELGITVRYIGVPLSNFLKEGYHSLTF